MSAQLVPFAYLAAASLFILGLHNLSSPKTAPRGNALAAAGMLIAIVAALLEQGVVDYVVVLAGVVVGSAISLPRSRSGSTCRTRRASAAGVTTQIRSRGASLRTRRQVSTSIGRGPIRERNCLGWLVRLSGQNRVPLPPASRMT